MRLDSDRGVLPDPIDHAEHEALIEGSGCQAQRSISPWSFSAIRLLAVFFIATGF